MCIDLALTTNSALGPRAKFLRSGLNPALPQVNEIQTWVNADPGWVNASFDLALTPGSENIKLGAENPNLG